MTKLLVTLVLMAIMVGCDSVPLATNQGSMQKPSLTLRGGPVYKNGQWVESVYVENCGTHDLVVGDIFYANTTYRSPDGIGLLNWYPQLHQCHYVVLRPSLRVKSGYVRLDSVDVEIPLTDDLFRKEAIQADISFELKGQMLAIEGDKIVTKYFVLSANQAIRRVAERR